jgi:hypothetical protein
VLSQKAISKAEGNIIDLNQSQRSRQGPQDSPSCFRGIKASGKESLRGTRYGA